MADFFREVDEDVRRDQAIRFWKKYQNWIIGAVVIIIAATAAWRIYEYFRLKADEAAGTRYENALQLLTAGKSAQAVAAFDALSRGGPHGYSMLARLGAADALGAKDPDAAAKAYDAVAADPGVDEPYRAVARLRAAYLRVDSEDPKQYEDRYAIYAGPDHPYRNLYRELLALAALRRGDLTTAEMWFDEIAADPGAPGAVRGRAAAFLEVIQGGKLPK
jgi:hypothetical protein